MDDAFSELASTEFADDSSLLEATLDASLSCVPRISTGPKSPISGIDCGAVYVYVNVRLAPI